MSCPLHVCVCVCVTPCAYTCVSTSARVCSCVCTRQFTLCVEALPPRTYFIGVRACRVCSHVEAWLARLGGPIAHACITQLLVFHPPHPRPATAVLLHPQLANFILWRVRCVRARIIYKIISCYTIMHTMYIILYYIVYDHTILYNHT